MNAPALAALESPRLQGRVIPRALVSARISDSMFSLLASHFSGVDRCAFQEDLADKDAVIVLEDDVGVLRGFSTLRVYQTAAPGRRVTIIYSGDTIVDRGSWGSPALARTWIDCVRQAAASAACDAYWLLITSGYRTYRFLPGFFRAFYPRYDQATPAGEQVTLDAVASERFGSRYDPGTGLVRLDRPQVLAGDLLSVPAGRSADAHIRFFLERNPGFVLGDELACLTRIHDDNLTPAGRRMAGIRRA